MAKLSYHFDQRARCLRSFQECKSKINLSNLVVQKSHVIAVRVILASVALSLLASMSMACNIPVFRYALENWRPDEYPVVVLHRGPLTESQTALMRNLQQSSNDPKRPANVLVFDVDMDSLAEPKEGERQELPPELGQQLLTEYAKVDLSEPKVVAFFPRQGPRLHVAWSGVLSQENVMHLVHSPARQEIADLILDGDSAVWVLIECGDKERDQQIAELLKKEIERLTSVVELPDQSLIESEEEFRPDNPIDLRVGFSLVVVSRDDVKEKPFISMLLRSEEDLVDLDGPIAIPIFGRGRTYFGLVDKGINPELIESSCKFVCGACSCQVKRDNPGADMLMAVDWASRIIGTAMKEQILPELTGIGGLEASIGDAAKTSLEESSQQGISPTTMTQVAATNTTNSASDTLVASTEADSASREVKSVTTAETKFEKSLLFWTLGIVGGIAVAMFGISLIWINVSNK